MDGPLRALLYVPTGAELQRILRHLTAAAEVRGWRPCSYTRSWAELVTLLATGQQDIAVAATRAHLPPDRLPRLVIVDEEPPPAGPAAAPRRPTWCR